MAKKPKKKKKGLGKIKGFSMRFLPYSEIRDLNSDERIKKILDICLKNNIIILQGRLRPEEESRLIGDTMAMIGHVKDFKGIELAVVSENNKKGFWDKLRERLINTLSKGDLGAVTIIGPATVVKEIKRDPKKIELMLNK
ncbi:MAG TPA: DUF2073 domain-containing protein [Candidatus Nanoarchaeia archaeon]|nr:DUF2073 domain-containing protein [Candidatus Nanoarchaeia archaeon]